ncbi:MAG: HAMP domain-containing histidine kinase [Clostridia bacterium]|nr:HAMP domain-containing histidine kinase [Clostridia bacterium]
MNGSGADDNRIKRSRYGIRWKMYAILIAFVGVALGIIWFFQIQTVSYFYQATKFGELENASLLISRELDDATQLEDIANEHSSEYYEDIWICKVVDGKPKIALFAQSTAGDISHAIVANFGTLYSKAISNEGNYIALVTHGTYSSSENLRIVKDNFGSTGEFPYMYRSSDRLQAIYVTVHETEDTSYMVVQSTVLTPVSAVGGTIKNQFIWIGIILAIAAMLTAVFLSKLITKPIVTMNEAAKRLAKGEYNADFSVVSGYREIDELGDSLNFASRELAKTDNLQKELISNISHDLRTPLTMIKGYGEVMRDIPGENTAENIQIIIDETSRLSELVNDMLDLSKIQAGTRKPDMQVFSLTQTVRDTMQRYERLTMQDGYSIEFTADTDVDVSADRGMILQVVYNLINNAINYTGEDKKVSVSQTVKDGKVKVSVTDTGEGIAEDQIASIWNRYYKVDKVHKRATVGTGLGLSIVKEVLELHGASYGVQSTVGVGSIFWFELDVYKKSETGRASYYIEADYEVQDEDTK